MTSVAWFDWLNEIEAREDNPAWHIRSIREPRRVPKAFTAAQVRDLLAAAADVGQSWWTFVLVLAYTGMRVSEARLMRWSDVAGGGRP